MQTRTWELKGGVAPVSFPGATGSVEKNRPLPCWTGAVSAGLSPVTGTGPGDMAARAAGDGRRSTQPRPEPGGRRAEQQCCLQHPG